MGSCEATNKETSDASSKAHLKVTTHSMQPKSKRPQSNPSKNDPEWNEEVIEGVW